MWSAQHKAKVGADGGQLVAELVAELRVVGVGFVHQRLLDVQAGPNLGLCLGHFSQVGQDRSQVPVALGQLVAAIGLVRPHRRQHSPEV